MPQLIILLSAQQTFSVPLVNGAITLGRAAENTALIDEPTISRRHARLIHTPGGPEGGWTLEDLNSSNGTRRNGVNVVGTVALRNGDALEFGSVRALFCMLPPDAMGSSDAPRDKATGRPDTQGLLTREYRLETFSGMGPGFSSYRAQDTATRQPVAVKVFNVSALHSAEAHELLTQAVSRLQAHPHPNIVAPLALERHRDQSFLVSEWVTGLSLLSVLRRRRALSVPEALQLLAQVAEVLDHGREHDLPHLDLHPVAILLSPAPRASNETLAESLLDEPFDRWPPFLLKLAPLLVEPEIAPENPGHEPATVIGSLTATTWGGEEDRTVFALSELLCEMLGHPLSRGVVGPNPKAPRIIGLGERGNVLLRRGLVQGGSFRNAREFYHALADVARALSTD